jgi:exodeoxyribonuclease VII large subunit
MNITELCNLLKKNIPNEKFKINGEVSQIKISHGNLYFTLKDNLSSIKAIIWCTKTKNNYEIKDGDKITVLGKLDYYSYTGTFSLIIENIIENDGIGDLQIKYDQLKENFFKKGYFNKKMPLPKYIKNILIITSETGAAIQDFLFNLDNNRSKIIYEIINVPVQGPESPKIISNKLNQLNTSENTKYDLIVITRGGGSYQDLFGFSNEELIESVFNFNKVPIMSAIGHQIDNPILDLVADYSCPTPSLSAQFLVDYNKNYLSNLNSILNKFKDNVIENLYEKQTKLNNLNDKLKQSFVSIKNILYKFQNNIGTELNNKKIKLEYLLKSLDNPNIELFDLNFNKINDSSALLKDNIFILKWNNQNFRISILD